MSMPKDVEAMQRDTLPVYPWIGAAHDGPSWAAMRDLMHLVESGLLDRRFSVQELPDGTVIPQPSQDAFAEGVALLEETGQLGVYERHVRATGTVYECPEWCQAVDHPRVGIFDSTAMDCGPNHRMVLPAAPDGQDLTVVGGVDGELVIVVDQAFEVSPVQARVLAGQLLAAAERVESLAG